jgi:hypothetical protein
MMTTRRAARRPGLTLTEALVGMFLAAIGLIALLTLFPLGALQMGQALKDDRCTQAALQADGFMRWHWRKMLENNSTNEEYYTALTNGDGATAATAGQPSYPVFVDPIGWCARTGTAQRRIVNRTQLPRRNLSNLAATPALLTSTKAFRICTLLDDLTFDETKPGEVKSPVERVGRYNWLAVLQRPEQSMQRQANLTVVVFDTRAPGYAPSSAEQEFTNVSWVPGTTNLTLSYTGQRPAIFKGRWIMDATTTISNSAQVRHAKFYRVVSVNDETAGQLVLELQTPITRNDNSTTTYTGNLVVLSGAAEVFNRPPLMP